MDWRYLEAAGNACTASNRICVARANVTKNRTVEDIYAMRAAPTPLITLFLICAALIPMTATGQATGTDRVRNQVADNQIIEEVVTIGTKRSERSASDLAVAVDIIGREDLLTQGSSDTLDILAASIPSYNVVREPISDAASLVRPAGLRGLPADSTLILLNGKRRHRSAVIAEAGAGVNQGAHGIDIAPLAGIAMKQVEVLRDGASAQYGSDAIAGVINFSLADDPTIRYVQVQAGSYYEGDGDNLTLSGVFGFPWRQDGFFTIAFEAQEADPTSRGSQDPAAAALIQNGNTAVADPVVVWGSPEVKDNLKLLFNAALPIGAGELYSFGTWATRDIDGSFFYRNPNTRENVFAIGPNDMKEILVADLTPDDGQSCPRVPVTDGIADTNALRTVIDNPNCFVFNELFPGGFTPRFGGTVEDQSLSFGWRGAHHTSGFTYDLSVTAGQNEVTYEIRHTVNASYGPDSPTAFDIGVHRQSEILLNADFAVPVNIGTYSDLNIAFGAQHHDEEYKISPGQDESWMDGGFADQGFSVGSNGFQGFSPDIAGSFTRTSTAAYVELEADITEQWLLSGAVRYEDFEDFGGTTNFKLASLLRLSDGFGIRGSISTGFRAPSVGQINLRRSATLLRDSRLVEVLTVAPTHPIAMLLGGKQLEPEESLNISIGGVFSLGPVNVTLDWFQIAVDNRIRQTRKSITEENQMVLQRDGVAGAGTISEVIFFINDFDSETTGIDLIADWPFVWAVGNSNLTLAYSWVDTAITSLGTTLTEVDAREIENGLPQNRVTLSWYNTKANWSSLVRLNYYDQTTEYLFGESTSAITAHAITLVDVELTWTRPGNTNYSVSVGAKNIFDAKPDEHQYANTAGFFGADFPIAHPAGFGGGSYYLRLAADF